MGRSAGAVLVGVLLVGSCGGGGEDDLAALERQVALADRAMEAVGTSLLQEPGGRTTGPGRGTYGECLPPSRQVDYGARVTFRSLGVSDGEAEEIAERVLEDLGWTVEPGPGDGFRADRGPMVAYLNVEGLGARFSVDTECVDVPDRAAVLERPETTFGLD
ncbi:hypothetical protein [Aeromicrobium sp.]|uniref:hypothetical protein n=1 Tax=Aeromicrobium sp. TaxID=1871063 RepID=UPI004034C496